MMTLVANEEACTKSECRNGADCILKSVNYRGIIVSENRYRDDEETREAIKFVIGMCPHKAIELQTCEEQYESLKN